MNNVSSCNLGKLYISSIISSIVYKFILNKSLKYCIWDTFSLQLKTGWKLSCLIKSLNFSKFEFEAAKSHKNFVNSAYFWINLGLIFGISRISCAIWCTFSSDCAKKLSDIFLFLFSMLSSFRFESLFCSFIANFASSMEERTNWPHFYIKKKKN